MIAGIISGKYFCIFKDATVWKYFHLILIPFCTEFQVVPQSKYSYLCIYFFLNSLYQWITIELSLGYVDFLKPVHGYFNMPSVIVTLQ